MHKFKFFEIYQSQHIIQGDKWVLPLLTSSQMQWHSKTSFFERTTNHCDSHNIKYKTKGKDSLMVTMRIGPMLQKG